MVTVAVIVVQVVNRIHKVAPSIVGGDPMVDSVSAVGEGGEKDKDV